MRSSEDDRGEIAVAVVGCGWWASTAHLPALRDDPRARLVAIAERDEGKRALAAARFGVERAFADWRELLDAVPLDALVVATPQAHHYAPAAAALERGIHVLVEKPLVVDPREGERLLELAREHGAHLLVGYTLQHTPHAIHLREQIAAGRIGAVEHVSCTFASAMRATLGGRPDAARVAAAETSDGATYSVPGSGGQAQAQLTHSAALALHLTGLAPRRVSAMTASFELAVDLADVLAVELSNGALAALDSAGMLLDGQSEILQCRIFGADGHVQLDATAGRASLHGRDGAVEHLPELAEDERYPLHAPARNLLGVVLGEEPNRTPGELGQQVVLLLDAALRAARTGQAVEISSPEAPRR